MSAMKVLPVNTYHEKARRPQPIVADKDRDARTIRMDVYIASRNRCRHRSRRGNCAGLNRIRNLESVKYIMGTHGYAEK